MLVNFYIYNVQKDTGIEAIWIHKELGGSIPAPTGTMLS
jgi:hypothetical protein